MKIPFAPFRQRKFSGSVIDLDEATEWPASVRVVEQDDFGPLVIGIADATVFPDFSVKTIGEWLQSARFGLARPNGPFTEVRALDTAHGFVVDKHDSLINLATSIGPRLATLGRSRPSVSVMISNTRHPVSGLLASCGVTPAGFLLDKGFAYRVPEALFVRLPSDQPADGQVELFASLFREQTVSPSAAVFLEHNSGKGKPVGDTSPADARQEHEERGATLLPLHRMGLDRIARTVASAATVTLESPELAPFAAFAAPTAAVTTVEDSTRFPRRANRVTMSGRFDMDDALRHGHALPPGVDIISRPDYDVDDTTVDHHSVFEGRHWRRQSDSVLIENSPGPFLVAVKNAIVSPHGAVLLSDGTLLAGTYFGEPRGDVNIDGWITDEANGRAGLALTSFKAFGHGLLQVAPRVDALTRYDEGIEMLVGEYLWDDSALLSRAGARTDRIRRVSRNDSEHLIRVPELIVSTQLQPERQTARVDPRWFSHFLERFTTGATEDGSRKVHLARRIESGHRGGCVNRREIHDIAEEFGYETVYPETLTLDDQIRLATSTTDMFGEQGSALTWAMFMPAGSRLTVVQNKANFRKNRYLTYYNPGLAARGSRYRDIGAVRAGSTSNFEIDPAIVRRAIERLP